MFERGADERRRAVVRPHVAAALDQPVGAPLLASLTALMAQDLTAREALEAACAWQRLQAHCCGGQLEAVARLDAAGRGDAAARGRPGRRDSTRPAADELAPALRIAPSTATRLVLLARQVESLPAAADALADGTLHPGQLRVLAEVTRGLPESARRSVESLAVRRAPTSVPTELADALAEEACRADPAHAEREAARGTAERDVRLTRSPLPGCRRFVADLPTLDAVAAWQVVNGAAVAARDGAPTGCPERRSVPQLRADVLASVLTGQVGARPPDGSPATAVPVRVPTPAERTALAEVHVVVSADDLPGAAPDDPPDDPPAEPPADPPADPGGVRGDGPGDGPGAGPGDGGGSPGPAGHVPGHGPLDAAATGDALRRAPWRRLVAAAVTGTLLERGSTPLPPPAAGCPDERRAHLVTHPGSGAPPPPSPGYRPGRALAAFVRARDATCIGAACHHAARTAGVQLDHTVDHARGGPTAAGNLAPQCRRVHQAKTHGGWRLAQPAPGSFTWTSPLGRTYDRRARALLPSWSRRHEPPART